MSKFKEIKKYSGLRSFYNLETYFKNYIFKNVKLKNKKLLDIGGGNGLACFYAVLNGKCSSGLVLDPIDTGSNKKMFNQYNSMKKLAGINDKIKYFNGTIEEFNKKDTFDVVLMHNSINHINENLVQTLHNEKKSIDFYKNYFSYVHKIINKNGHLIISDCSNRNFFNDIGIKNPFAPSINWKIHQSTKVWSDIIIDCGFKIENINYCTRRELGLLGLMILNNRLSSYLTTSHFSILFKAI